MSGRVEGIPLEEELGYERTVAKLEERWGVALRTYDGRCPAEEWTGIYQGDNLLPGVLFQASTSFRPRISRIREGQLLHIPAKVDRYKVGS